MGLRKNYLIEQELSEALRETHYIVRVSLLALDSVEALNNAVKKQWLAVCTPFLGKLDQERDKMKKYSSFISGIGRILTSLSPLQGSIASELVAVDPLEYIPVEPVVEDHLHGGKKKRVVLVFDDLSRTRMDLSQIVGTINKYCEIMGFTTIVVAEEAALRTVTMEDAEYYMMIREKTIARTVRYVPDYRTIIHAILTRSDWPSQEYAEYLAENEQTIYEVFVSNGSEQRNVIWKTHNFRSLLCALKEFGRLFALLREHQIPGISRYLYSFMTYILISRSGVLKNGKLCFDVQEEDIRRLYPEYDAALLPVCVREWIEHGIWEEDEMLKAFAEQIGTDGREMETNASAGPGKTPEGFAENGN